MAVAALPLVAALLISTAGLLRRRRVAPGASTFWSLSLVLALFVIGAAATLVSLADMTALPPVASLAIGGFASLALVALLPMSLWWRRRHRRRASRARLRFILEQVAAGAAMAAVLWLVARLLHDRITPSTLSEWQLPLFPLELNGTLYLTGLVFAELTAFWAFAMVLAVMADRWGLRLRRIGPGVAASALWLLPTVALAVHPIGPTPLPRLDLVLAGVCAVVIALGGAGVRRWYRHTTQAMRLVLLFSALVVPLIVLYPVGWFYADQTARAIVENDYALATQNRPRDVLAGLTRARGEIDQIPLARMTQSAPRPASPDAPIPTSPAFDIWRLTSLSTTRVTSSIELYRADGSLVSRFALNVPEYGGVTDLTLRSRTPSCQWEVVGEAVPFGAEERKLIHAERAICDDAGRIAGAIIVHVINDYQALPFVSTANPYREVLASPESGPAGPAIADLQVVVYGWSFSPTFTSGNVAWPITADLFNRLYRSRDAFWTTLDAEGRTFDVHFSNDQQFVYALGYPAATLFQHVTRLTEAVALAAVIFVLLLVGAALYAPFTRTSPAPLTVLFEEVRTSFYRKLFLFFVLAAIGPVFTFALAFDTYTSAKFRADVEGEAATVVTVARRVLEQSIAFASRPGELRTALNDDVMVWVSQVLHQDVNLFEGPDLIATSQRDLYASGLLPTRTPAKVYRGVALNRLPTFVAEDRLGSFGYLVAGAPIPAAGQQAVLSVPLALRQRERQREIDDLRRGVLVGAVLVVVLAAGLGASIAGRVADPVARLSRATRQIAAGKLDVRVVADTADELRRLVDDFNGMAATLSAQRAELARTNQLKAWAEMARQVAHEIKNPLTPIQLSAEHLRHVHADQGRPLGAVFDQCLDTILRQVRLLRQIASEFANFAGQPAPRPASVPPRELVEEVLRPYGTGTGARVQTTVDVPDDLPDVFVDRLLVARALTNLVENAWQAMPQGGAFRATGRQRGDTIVLILEDGGVGMDAESVRRAFEPYFSTKTAGSGLGLANAKRNLELCGGTIAMASVPGRGTTVTVTLPAVRSAAPAAASTPAR
jgi:signal transduction histidine kinase